MNENLKKGESAQKNIQKTKAEIVKTKPSYITIEDFNVSGMMKHRHLSKAVASKKFAEEIPMTFSSVNIRSPTTWIVIFSYKSPCREKADLICSFRIIFRKYGIFPAVSLLRQERRRKRFRSASFCRKQ